MLYKKAFVKSFGKFSGKHLFLNTFFSKLKNMEQFRKRNSTIIFFAVAIAKFLRTPVLINTCEHILSMFQDNIQKMKLSLIHFNRKYKESVESYGSIIIYLKNFQISLLMQFRNQRILCKPCKT